MSMKFIRIGTLPAHSSYALQLRAVITAEKAYHGQLNCVLAQVRSSLMASLRSHGALHVSVAESQKNVLPSLRIHISLCSHAPSSHRRKPTLNTCRWRNHRVCPLACVRFVQCVPAAGICMADCFMHHCVVVPKAGNVTVAMFKDEAHQSTSGLGTDVLQVRNQIPAATLMPGGDLAKC